MTRRARGEGSIRKRKGGLWESRITVGPDGRRSVYGHTQREVRDKLTAALEQQRLGILPDPDRQTLAQYLAAWLRDTVKPSVRPATYRQYEYACRVYLAPAPIGSMRLAKVTPQQVQRWLNDLSARDLAPQSVRSIFNVLRKALSVAVKWGMIARNPASLVDKPTVARREMQILAPEQVAAFLDTARSDRLYALYALAIASGMREGELLALRWPDVDLDGAVVTVAHTVSRLNDGWVLSETKTKAGNRRVDLPPFVVKALRQHRVRQLEERLQAGERWRDTGFVFSRPDGQMITPSSLLHQFKALLAVASIPPIRFHDLRHTAASLMLAQGLPARMIMEMLGHSKIGITMDTYTHILPSLRKEAALAMERALNP